MGVQCTQNSAGTYLKGPDNFGNICAGTGVLSIHFWGKCNNDGFQGCNFCCHAEIWETDVTPWNKLYNLQAQTLNVGCGQSGEYVANYTYNLPASTTLSVKASISPSKYESLPLCSGTAFGAGIDKTLQVVTC